MAMRKTLEELESVPIEDLTPEERTELDRLAFADIRRIAKEVAARNGGPDPERSEDVIREMRAQRTRELLERSGMIPVGDDEAWEQVRERDRQRAEERCLELEQAAAERAERERSASKRSIIQALSALAPKRWPPRRPTARQNSVCDHPVCRQAARQHVHHPPVSRNGVCRHPICRKAAHQHAAYCKAEAARKGGKT